MVKAQIPTVPTYESTDIRDNGVATVVYKNSTSSATTYNSAYSNTAWAYSANDAGNSTACCRFKGNAKTLSYMVGNSGSSSIGLAPSTEYSYIVIYSS